MSQNCDTAPVLVKLSESPCSQNDYILQIQNTRSYCIYTTIKRETNHVNVSVAHTGKH